MRFALAFACALGATSPLCAADVLYDFEAGDGRITRDRLTDDGAQDGIIAGNVTVQDVLVPFGSRAALFEPPDVEEPEPVDDPDNDRFSTLEIPGTMQLGSAWTIAAFVEYENTGFTRLFSSYAGTGAVGPGRILVDFDPSGSSINYLRVIIGGEVSQALFLPEALLEPGFKHVALTFEDGFIQVYLNGELVDMDLETVSTTAIEADVDLRVGEDANDGNGTGNEQLLGNVDDVLVLGRALSAEEVAAVAGSGVDGQVRPADGELAIFYDFEAPDSGTTVTDRFTGDGSQDGVAWANTRVDPDVAHPLFGSQSLRFGRPELFSTIEVPETEALGFEWTLAAHVNYTNTGFTRIFSSYQGAGAVEPNRVILDFDPRGQSVNFIRVYVGSEAAVVDGAPASVIEKLNSPGYKHFAVTFLEGLVDVYLDGERVPMTLSQFSALDAFAPVNLRIGEDANDANGTVDEQLEGWVDDVVVITRYLDADEVAELAASSAADVLDPEAVGTAVLYDFEEESEGATITDKLLEDGAQDGIARKDVAVRLDSDQARFGRGVGVIGDPQAEPEGPPPPPYDQIEIPETMTLGSSWTVSAFVDYTNTGFTRLFSSYQGTGGVLPNRMILDIDPSGGQIFGIRVIVGSTSDPFNIAQALEIPPELAEPGFKHFALTFEEGEIHVYLNGEEVPMDNEVLTTTESSAPVNLRFGEDPHDAGGSANEEFDGHVDDLFVYGRALSEDEVLAIAENGVADSGFAPEDGVFAVYYDFESPDAGAMIGDRFTADGAQDAIAHNDVAIDDTVAHPLFGSQSLLLGGGGEEPGTDSPFSSIDTGVSGVLGSSVTFAATINVPDGGFAGGGLARILSTYSGTGSPAGRFILDVNPDADVSGIGVRVILPDGTILIDSDPFTVDEDHHVAVVYDEGFLDLWFDGELIQSIEGLGGPIDLGDFSLRIGEDLGGVINENFIGVMDDVLILGTALGEDEIVRLAKEGSAFLAPGTTGVGPFLRGDATGDGILNLTDAVNVLGFLFLGSAEPGCLATADATGDGTLNLTDAVSVLGFLFLGGSEPAAPFPNCGTSDSAADLELGCETLPPGC